MSSNLPVNFRPRTKRHRLWAVVAGATLLAAPVLVGCSDDDDTGDGLTADTTAPVGGDLGGEATEEGELEGTDGTVDLSGAGEDPVVEIRAGDGSFEPSTVTVEARSTVSVTFENEGTSDHSFTIEELGIDEVVEPNGTVTVEVPVPAEEGTLAFVCRFHQDGGMTGTFEIVAADDDANSTTTALTDGTGDPGGGSAPEGGTVPIDPGGQSG
jgi:plastocyanin